MSLQENCVKATNRVLLGVNIDHVATLRQARGTRYPDPVYAALQAEEAGADGITLHLREDRRHIQDRDVYVLNGMLNTRMNLEMAVTEEMIAIASKHSNVYIGSDAYAPKYWNPEFVHFINTWGQNKVIFGTDFPVIDFRRAMDEIEGLSLNPESKLKFLRDNAIRVYNLPL